MKQFFIVALTALFLFSAAACSKKTQNQAQKKPVKGKVVQTHEK